VSRAEVFKEMAMSPIIRAPRPCMIEFSESDCFKAIAGLDVDYANIVVIGNIYENAELLELDSEKDS